MDRPTRGRGPSGVIREQLRGRDTWYDVCVPNGVDFRALRLCVAGWALLVAGCGASAKVQPKTADDSYDWSTYQGTFAPDGPGVKAAEEPKAEKADKPEKPDKAEEASARSDAAPTKHVSTRKIRGESVSSVTADVVAGASKSAFRAKVVSTNVVVGPEYEQLQVVLKNAAVQIVRPAATPDKEGPKIRSPKARNDDLGKTDSAWYDRDADVLVLVQAKKKATSRRVLNALLKR